MCLIPNPKATRDASGEEKLTAKSGLNFRICFASSLLLSKLATSLSNLSEPPCFPKYTKLVCPKSVIPVTCRYFLDVHNTVCLVLSFLINGSENRNCLGVIISNQIFKY